MFPANILVLCHNGTSNIIIWLFFLKTMAPLTAGAASVMRLFCGAGTPAFRANFFAITNRRSPLNVPHLRLAKTPMESRLHPEVWCSGLTGYFKSGYRAGFSSCSLTTHFH